MNAYDRSDFLGSGFVVLLIVGLVFVGSRFYRNAGLHANAEARKTEYVTKNIENISIGERVAGVVEEGKKNGISQDELKKKFAAKLNNIRNDIASCGIVNWTKKP